MNNFHTHPSKNHVFMIERSGKRRMFPKIFRVILLSVIFFLMAGYIIFINNASTRGFVLKDLEYQRDKLKKENESLEFEVNQAQTLSEIEKRIQTLAFVPIAKVEYLEIKSTQVALK